MQRITITIPTTDNKGKSYGPDVRQRIESDLMNLFGGFTQVGVRGAWASPDGSNLYDVSRRYEILTKYDTDYEKLKAYARDICADLRQECILTTCESVQYDFIT